MKLDIRSSEDRRKMTAILADAGYKVHVEVEHETYPRETCIKHVWVIVEEPDADVAMSEYLNSGLEDIMSFDDYCRRKGVKG